MQDDGTFYQLINQLETEQLVSVTNDSGKEKYLSFIATRVGLVKDTPNGYAWDSTPDYLLHFIVQTHTVQKHSKSNANALD